MPDKEENKPLIDPARALSKSYPPNSKKSKQESEKVEKKVERLEGVKAIKQKPPMGRRIREAFTGDSARGIGDYLIFEVALPAIKTTLFDLINQGANRALFGPGSQAPGAANRRPGVVNYNQISRNQVNQPQVINISARDKATHKFDNILFGTRQEAEVTLSALLDIVDRFDVAAVSDLYELVGVTGSFVDDKWGWFNLQGADIVPVRGGFILDLPATQPIR
jgi:hypothetical protein